MQVLAIDTALEACAAAVLNTESGTVTMQSLTMVRGHAEKLMPLVDAVMKEAGATFASLDRIAVTTGPGSFTGLRVGIAAARGIALSTGKPAIGVTTLEAYAAPWIAHDDKTAVAVAIDARHQHVYLQTFTPGGRSQSAPRIDSVPNAVRAAMASGPVRIVGTGAGMLAAAWPSHEAPPVQVDDRRSPDIAWVARLALAPERDTSRPKPLYLRAPDAQPQDAARLPRR
jgi:tRNA threonylcarbamoyl adenosine modification protein YeaZ